LAVTLAALFFPSPVAVCRPPPRGYHIRLRKRSPPPKKKLEQARAVLFLLKSFQDLLCKNRHSLRDAPSRPSVAKISRKLAG